MAISKGRALSATINSATSIIKSSIDGTVTTTTIEQSAQQYAGVGDLPTSGNSFGEMALIQSTNRMYVWNGSGWYNVALVNTSPAFTTSPSGTYTLDGDSPRSNIQITVAASDPDSLAVTFTHSTSGQLDSIATVSQDSTNGRIFTVTPKGNDSISEGAYSGTLTISASDGVNIVPAVSTISLTFVTIVDHSSGTTMMMKVSGTGTNKSPVDSSTSTHGLTMAGTTAALSSFSPYKYGGYSVLFDGSDDELSFTLGSALGTGDWTVEYWAYHLSLGDHQIHIGIGGYDPAFYYRHTNQHFAYYDGSATEMTDNVPQINRWYHFAYVHDDSANTVKMYIDGNLEATLSSYTENLNDTDVIIGDDGTGANMHGYLADIRIVAGSTVYTANFTRPNEPLTAVSGTKFLLSGPNFIDKSSDNVAITVASVPSLEPWCPYNKRAYLTTDYGGSAHFASTDDEIKTNDAASDEVVLGSGDFTVEFWIYKHTAASSTWEALISQNYGNTGGWRIYKNSGSGAMRWYAAGVDTLLSNANPIRQNEWCHVAMVRASGTLVWYINGKASGSVSDSTNYTGGTDGEIEIGKGTVTSTYPVDAHMTDVRIVVGTAVYTGAFTPPSRPLTATGGTYPSNTNVNTSITAGHTKLLLNMTQAKVYDASQNREEIRLFGTAAASSAQTHFSENTVVLDGNSDYLKGYSHHLPLLSETDWTFETWVRVATNNTRYDIFNQYSDSTSGRFAIFIDTNGKINLFQHGINSDALIVGATAISATTWHHVAIVNGHQRRAIFLDGARQVTPVYEAGADMEDRAGLIGVITTGGSFANYFNGYLHDMRITKGVGRYPWVPDHVALTTTNSTRSGVTVTASNTKLICCASTSDVTAKSGANSGNITITNNGGVASTKSPFTGGGSVYFAADDYLEITDSSTTDAWQMGTSAFTLEYYIYFNSNLSGGTYHPHMGGTGTNQLMITRHSGNFVLKLSGGAASITAAGNDLIFKLTQWHHVAICRTSGGVMTMFVDGKEVGQTSSSIDYVVGSGTFRIGGADGSDELVDAYVSNVRMIQGEAVYSDGFTAPTSAFIN